MDVDQFVDQYYQGFGDTGGKCSLDKARSKQVIHALARTLHLPGDVAECGVWKGGTAWLIAKFLELNKSEKSLYLFDTFSGMPVSGENDTHPIGDFNDTSYNEVYAYLECFNYTSIIPGVFPESFDEVEFDDEERFSFVHADMDQEQSTKAIIDCFWPRMIKGGIIAFDDYHNPKCAGVKIAVDALLTTEHAGEGIQIAIK